MEIYPVEAYAQTAIDISIDEASLGKIDSEVKIIHGRRPCIRSKESQ